MSQSRRKKIGFILLVLFALYAAWLGFHLATFRTYGDAAEDDPLEIEGVYHIHTKFSDGYKTPDKIAEPAAAAGLDFIILTDHGSPNRECLESQGWKQGVLVLAGSELSVSRGHLVALDFVPPAGQFPQNADLAVTKISMQEGFSIIAHPYSKVQWSWGKNTGSSGLEIINADTMFKQDIHRWVPYLPALLLRPPMALLKMIQNPEKELRKWDELNQGRMLYGYFSTDAHFLYRPLMSHLRLHVLLEKTLSSDFDTAKHQVFQALRTGRFFNAVESAAEARGFRFRAEAGHDIQPMGSALSFRSSVRLLVEAPFSFAKEIVLYRDGVRIFASRQNRVRFDAQEPGSYRVQVHLKEKTPLDKNAPWIVSNPIFLREERP